MAPYHLHQGQYFMKQSCAGVRQQSLIFSQNRFVNSVDGTQNGQDRNDQEGFRFMEVIMEGIPQVRKVSQKEDEVAGAINSLLVFFIEFSHTVKHAIHSLKKNNTISCRGIKVINDYYFLLNDNLKRALF